MHWAARNLQLGSMQTIVFETPLVALLLMARQEQWSENDQVMNLGDKELIDELNRREKTKNGN